MQHRTLASKLFYAAQAIMSRCHGIYARNCLITGHNHDWMHTPSFQMYRQAAAATYPFDLRNDWSLHVVLWAAHRAYREAQEIVECGTNFGWMMRGVCAMHPEAKITCFDTFKGFDRRWPSYNHDLMTYRECYDEVKATFAPFPNVKLVRGSVPDSLYFIDRIGLLHIDMNCVYPETAAVRFFWDRIVPGGVIISDDYGHPGMTPQKEAWDELSATLGHTVLSLPTGQGMLVK